MSSSPNKIATSSVMATLGGAIGALSWAAFAHFDAQSDNHASILSYFILGACAVNLAALSATLSKRREGLILGAGIWFFLLFVHAPFHLHLLVAGVCFLGNVFTLRKTQQGLDIPGMSVMALCMGVIWVLTPLNFYHVPSWEEVFRSSGVLTLDPVFHSAVANLLTRYGVVSNGVEGLSPMTYHVASHWLLGSAARVTNTSAMDAYQLGFFPMLLPLLLFGIDSAIRTVSEMTSGAISQPKVWLGIAVLLAGVLPFNVGRAHMYQFHSVFLSESYAFGIVGLLWVIASLGPRLVLMFRNREPDDYLGILSCAVLLGTLGYFKISIPLVVLPALGYVLLRSRRWTLTAVYTLFSSVVLMALYLSVGEGMESGVEFNPLFPILKFKESPSIIFFQPWLLFYLFMRLGAHRISIEEVKSGRLLDVEFFTVMTLISLVPGALIPIAAGSEIYFSEVPMWFIAPAVIVALSKREFRQLPILALLLIVQFSFHGVGNIVKAAAEYAKYKVCISGDTKRCDEVGVEVPAIQTSPEIREGFLGVLSSMNHPENFKYGVFVPMDSVYWDMNPDKRILVFLVPAVSGLPLWGGLSHIPGGGNFYGLDGLEQLRSNSPKSESEALYQACDSGFHGILVVESHQGYRKDNCPEILEQ